MAALRQRGFITLIQLAVYAGIFLAVAGVIGGAVYQVKKWGGDEVRAELMPILVACESLTATLGGQIKAQNDAVEALQAESARRQATSAAALRKAEQRAQTWDAQATRLTAVLAARKPTDDQSCGAAWKDIREPK